MNPSRKLMTLEEFTIQELRNYPRATGELSGLLRDIGLAAKRVNAEVNKAGLVDILGDAGHENVQGESVKKLDDYANNWFIEVLRSGINCAGVGSEENEDVIIFNDALSNKSKYVLLMDPLDGSGNIDVNVSIGTIFSVYKRISPLDSPATKADFLQPGSEQMAAGYVIYGPSTILVYATKRGVNGFTLDPSIGEFCLSHRDIKCPAQGDMVSVNMGYEPDFKDGLKQYLADQFAAQSSSVTYRYTGSMVADVHRNLLKGGVFIYPPTAAKPQGKLRLLYECNPLAFIVEQAGGLAYADKNTRIREVKPEAIHQRCPMIIGAKNMVEDLLSYL